MKISLCSFSSRALAECLGGSCATGSSLCSSGSVDASRLNGFKVWSPWSESSDIDKSFGLVVICESVHRPGACSCLSTMETKKRKGSPDISSALIGKKQRISPALDDHKDISDFLQSSILKRDIKGGTKVIKNAKGKAKMVKGEVGGGSFQSMGQSITLSCCTPPDICTKVFTLHSCVPWLSRDTGYLPQSNDFQYLPF